MTTNALFRILRARYAVEREAQRRRNEVIVAQLRAMRGTYA
jgi:hypothetical protein